jgi:hypothetical protein
MFEVLAKQYSMYQMVLTVQMQLVFICNNSVVFDSDFVFNAMNLNAVESPMFSR